MQKKRLLPVPLLVLTDLLLIGAMLCVYALFHHVIHWNSIAPGALETTPLPDPGAYTKPVTAPQTEPPAPTGDTAESETSPVITDTPKNDWGQFGGRFYEKFTDGEVLRTDTLYVSESIRVEVSTAFLYDSVFHIEDIYIRNIIHLRTAFAGETYDSTRDTGLNIANRVGAVCSVNGDYPGFSNGGRYLVIRNGILYTSDPSADVCVLYTDGSVKIFRASNREVPCFNGSAELAAGAWQGWCFGPSLLNDDGTAIDGRYYNNYRNPRTMFGYYEPGHYCFVTVDGRSDTSQGVTLGELAEFAHSLGLTAAYNLDGGQSSTMTFGDSMINTVPPQEGVRKLSDIIYIGETEVIK